MSDLVLGQDNFAVTPTTLYGGNDSGGFGANTTIFGVKPTPNMEADVDVAGILGIGNGVGTGVTGTGGNRGAIGVNGLGGNNGGAIGGTGVVGTGGGTGVGLGGTGVAGTGGPVGGTGVVGTGGPAVPGQVGVQGGDGVHGTGGGSGVGVRGIGGHAIEATPKSGGGTGVAGDGGDTIDPTLRPGIGVTGRGGALRTAAPGSTLIHSEAGVLGVTAGLSPPATKDTIDVGVVGLGRVGVRGIGSADRAGIFESNTEVAQLRLVPSATVKALPILGLAGDFFVVNDHSLIPTVNPTCHLYFCVTGNVGFQVPAVWKKVVLVDP